MQHKAAFSKYIIKKITRCNAAEKGDPSLGGMRMNRNRSKDDTYWNY